MSETTSIYKMPRRDMNFFVPGKLYRLKHNDPKLMVRYTIMEMTKYQPDSGSVISPVVKKHGVEYEMKMQMNVYNSYALKNVFMCAEPSTSIIRNFKTNINGVISEFSIFKNVPLFLFHHNKTNKGFVGGCQIDMNNQNLEEMMGPNYKECLTADGLVYIENFYEEVVVD